MTLTAHLQDNELNDWVARTLGWKMRLWGAIPVWYDPQNDDRFKSNVAAWRPSTDWNQAGPIIQAEYSSIECQLTYWFGPRWNAHDGLVAESLLVWLMRALVASAQGEEVPDDVPLVSL